MKYPALSPLFYMYYHELTVVIFLVEESIVKGTSKTYFGKDQEFEAMLLAALIRISQDSYLELKPRLGVAESCCIFKMSPLEFFRASIEYIFARKSNYYDYVAMYVVIYYFS